MGRELRRVPPDWEHPKDDGGHLQPLYDKEYSAAADAWLAQCVAYHVTRTHPDLSNPEHSDYFWDWDGAPPDSKYYRSRSWTEAEATHFQVYETITEGTPISPVLSSREAVAEWLQMPGKHQGYSKVEAEAFAEGGWAPTAVIIPGMGWIEGIKGMLMLPNKDRDANP